MHGVGVQGPYCENFRIFFIDNSNLRQLLTDNFKRITFIDIVLMCAEVLTEARQELVFKDRILQMARSIIRQITAGARAR